MDNLLSRHRNLTVLVVVLFAQVVGLAVQVKHPAEGGSVRLVRLWTVRAITPIEKGVVYTRRWAGNVWRNYFYLRNVRKENEALRAEIERIRLEQVRLGEDASQARRLQALLGFKEQFIQQTLPAQVISTTGSEFSRGIYVDKGARDGLKPDMPVITPEGIVGKVFRAYPSSSLVLMINDPSSGVGVILEKSRLQGILKGAPSGETQLHNIMSDEQVQVGERVLTSGGDGIYPKGLPAGVVSSVSPGSDPVFLNVRVKPAAQLSRLEEVLVLTKVVEKAPEGTQNSGRQRAADVLAERLPSVPPKPPEATPGANSAAGPPAPKAPPADAGNPPAGAGGARTGEVKPPTLTAPAAAATTAAPTKAAPPPSTTLVPDVSGALPKPSPPPSATAPKKPANVPPGAAVPRSPSTAGAAEASKPAATPATNPPKAKPASGAAGKSATSGAKPEPAKPDQAKPQVPPTQDPPWQ